MKSSAVEALQKSHIENIAAFLGKSCIQTTAVLWTATGKTLPEGKRGSAPSLLCQAGSPSVHPQLVWKAL